MAISFLLNAPEHDEASKLDVAGTIVDLSLGPANTPTPPLLDASMDDTSSEVSTDSRTQASSTPIAAAATSAPASLSLQCRLCSKLFRERGNVVKHYRSVHATVRPHVCAHPGCNKSFSFRDGLTRHTSTVHQGLRAHKCPHPVCPQMFKQRSHAKKHYRTVHSPTDGASSSKNS
jgi:uncharacterized Zn-finger protein